MARSACAAQDAVESRSQLEAWAADWAPGALHLGQAQIGGNSLLSKGTVRSDGNLRAATGPSAGNRLDLSRCVWGVWAFEHDDGSWVCGTKCEG